MTGRCIEETEAEDTKRYLKKIGSFVNVDYATSDNMKKVAKGVLKDVINSKLIIHDLRNRDKYWEVHISSILNFYSEPVKV